MNSRKFSCCLLFRFVALFVLFSILLGVDVKADDLFSPPADLILNDNSVSILDDTEVLPYDWLILYENSTGEHLRFDGSFSIENYPSSLTVRAVYKLTNPIDKGNIFDIDITVGKTNCSINSLYATTYSVNWERNSASYDYVQNSYSTNSAQYSIKDLKADETSVVYISIYFNVTVHGNYCSFNIPDMSYTIQEVNYTGLLDNIIGWLSGIKDSIVNLPSTIASAIKGFFDNVVNAVNNVFVAIKELPATIWNFIETGLKNLFVPTETQVSDFNDKMNNLLSDRFGALYEVGDLCVQHIEAFQQYYEVGTINFPAVTVDLAGSPFTFGGWTVDICPDGFEFLFDALKLAIDMVCTLAVINGLKHRFDRLLGVK